MFPPNQRLGLLRERGAVWGRVRSGFPFGRGNSEGRTPPPKEPAALFTLFPRRVSMLTVRIYTGGDRGCQAWIHVLRAPRRTEFLPTTRSPLFYSAPPTLRGSCHNDPRLRAITAQPFSYDNPWRQHFRAKVTFYICFLVISVSQLFLQLRSAW